ncbi:MAG: hypothetical protein JO254_14875 [Pseudolabrys sp.]|nr:hypothetical protein [Pseudolabrys sp.]
MPNLIFNIARISLPALACVMVLLASPLAHGQQPKHEAPPQSEEASNPFASIGRWFEDGFTKLGSGFKDAQGGVDNFNREAGIAARSTADAARDAADAMVKLPNARVIKGHQNCPAAANGAPDCLAAATALCKSKGFAGGKSVDMTTAEECPTQVLLGRRAAEPGECKSVTFVSKALCQ